MRSLILPLLAAAFIPAAFAQDSPPGAAGSDAAEPGVFNPRRHDWSRYEKMAMKSPFEFELVEGPAEAPPNPFEGLSLAGFAGSGSNITAYLVDTKKNERIVVYSEGSGRRNDSGIRVVGLNRGKSLRETTVTLEKNGVTQPVAFDPGLLSSMVATSAAAVAPRAGIPGQPGANNQRGGNRAVRPAGQPGQPTAAAPGAYQAPAAFVASRNSQALANNQAQNVNPQGVPIDNLPVAENVNQLATPNQGRGQQGVVVGGGGARPAGPPQGGNRAQGANQVRRRVVLPSSVPSR